MNFIKKLLSGPDNSSPDLARVLFFFTWLIWAAACLIYLFTVRDPKELSSSFLNLFGVGSALLVSGSASVLIKHSTEPKTPPVEKPKA